MRALATGNRSCFLALFVFGALCTAASNAHSTSVPVITGAAAGEDLVVDAKAIFLLAACANEAVQKPASLPALTEKTRAAHCKEYLKLTDKYRTVWMARAAPLITSVVPADVPPMVVYPFGGGDLMTALFVFPNATEITTLSLERSGDVRGVRALSEKNAKRVLSDFRRKFAQLLGNSHSKTTNLTAASRELLPGEITFALAAIALHGGSPVSLRYFRIEDDGSLVYFNAGELPPNELRKSPDPKFDNVEIVFTRKEGKTATFRHIAANLDNSHLAAGPGLIRHLSGKGKVAMMTKAASYLLWWDEFATIRDYMIAHMTWMISDSTGIPPRFLENKGFEQVTYGRFGGPFLPGAAGSDAVAFKKLWASQPLRKTNFLFGYPDSGHRSHFLVTRPNSGR